MGRLLRRVGQVTVILLFVFLLALPWLEQHYFSNGRAFHNAAITRHQAGIQRKRKGVTANLLLRLTWFWKGHTKYALSKSLWSDGRLNHERVLYDNAIQGGYSNIHDTPLFDTLRTLPPLPDGLSGPSACPTDRILVVSQPQKSGWVTTYYDRAQLPPPIAHLAALLNLDLAPGEPNAGGMR